MARLLFVNVEIHPRGCLSWWSHRRNECDTWESAGWGRAKTWTVVRRWNFVNCLESQLWNTELKLLSLYGHSGTCSDQLMVVFSLSLAWKRFDPPFSNSTSETCLEVWGRITLDTHLPLYILPILLPCNPGGWEVMRKLICT